MLAAQVRVSQVCCASAGDVLDVLDVPGLRSHTPSTSLSTAYDKNTGPSPCLHSCAPQVRHAGVAGVTAARPG